MKKLAFAGLSAITFLYSCSTVPQKSQKEIQQEKKIVQIGESVSKKLLKSLKGELVKALKKNPLEAIEVCSQKALPITKKVEKEIDHGIKLKRTSLKYRNPANAPDEYEKEALRYFEENYKETGKIPRYYIQKVKENGKMYYRYYKPLKIKPVCLTCHGKQKYIHPDVYDKIIQIYPNDKATGYKVGNFRGVIRVSIPEEELK